MQSSLHTCLLYTVLLCAPLNIPYSKDWLKGDKVSDLSLIDIDPKVFALLNVFRLGRCG